MGKVSLNKNEALSTAKRQAKQNALEGSSSKERVDGAAQFPVPVYPVTDSISHVIHSNKPAAITFGHNKNYQTKSQVAMVAGTLGSLVTENDPENNNPVEVAYPTPTDAASVILSEMADFGDYNGRSVVTAKADVVGLRSAELIELRTGGIPYLANGHQTTNKYGGIHLISGDKTEGKDFDLQPMIKGENLKEMLADLIKSVQNLVGQVKTLNKDVINLKKDLINHNHLMVFTAPVITTPGGLVATFFGTTQQSLELITSLPPTIAKDNARMTTNLSGIDRNLTKVRQNYLEQSSPNPIKSRFNKVN